MFYHKKYNVNRGARQLHCDQFCVYVANQIILPALTQEQLAQFRDGDINLDMLPKKYIHGLDYQFCIADSSKKAFSLEDAYKPGRVWRENTTA